MLHVLEKGFFVISINNIKVARSHRPRNYSGEPRNFGGFIGRTAQLKIKVGRTAQLFGRTAQLWGFYRANRATTVLGFRYKTRANRATTFTRGYEVDYRANRATYLSLYLPE